MRPPVSGDSGKNITFSGKLKLSPLLKSKFLLDISSNLEYKIGPMKSLVYRKIKLNISNFKFERNEIFVIFG
jgi:hypothetical protein